MRASVISEAEDTPDVTGVTFVMCESTLVTVRYDVSESFEIYGQKICRPRAAALQPCVCRMERHAGLA